MITANSDEHREGIMEEVPGLRPPGQAREPGDDAHRQSVDRTIDDPAVTEFPEAASQPFRRPHENELVEFVEIPLVQEESIKPGLERPET